MKNNTSTAAALMLWPCPFMKAWVLYTAITSAPLIKGMYSTTSAASQRPQ